MTPITDLDELKKLADERRDDFEVMRYQLQEDDDLDDIIIDALVEKVAKPIVEVIDCTECANCCRNLDVQLGEDDLERLASGINVPIGDIRQNVEIIDFDDPDIVGIFKPKPCAFLKGKLCSVYAHRPTSCHDYPQFTSDFRWRLGWMIENTRLCPIIYNVLDTMVDKADDLQRDSAQNEDVSNE